jgi:hypothetical protein
MARVYRCQHVEDVLYYNLQATNIVVPGILWSTYIFNYMNVQE